MTLDVPQTLGSKVSRVFSFGRSSLSLLDSERFISMSDLEPRPLYLVAIINYLV